MSVVQPPPDIGTVTPVYCGQAWAYEITDETDGAPTDWSTLGTGFSAQARTSPDTEPPVTITVDASVDGTMILSMSASTTIALSESTYVFDVRATGGAIDPHYLLSGKFSTFRSVTR